MINKKSGHTILFKKTWINSVHMKDSSPTMAPSTWAFPIPKHATIEHNNKYADKPPPPLVAKSNY